jgi:hypothetical protein
LYTGCSFSTADTAARSADETLTHCHQFGASLILNLEPHSLVAILMDEYKRANCRLIFVTGVAESSEAYAADVERQASSRKHAQTEPVRVHGSVR